MTDRASSGRLQALCVAGLVNRTVAGADVFTPRTWPTTLPATPILLVRRTGERKGGLGRSGAPQFHTVATIRVEGRLTARAEPGDRAAFALNDALIDLQAQVEVALINDYELRRAIQQYVSVTSSVAVSAEGEQPIGSLIMDFELEFYQGPEDFAPIDADPILEFGVYADLVNVFSPTGTFAETPFPANPSPRTAGPDGRAEGVVEFDLTQD